MIYDGYLILSNGFEETEAITTIDILRRGGLNILTVSITGSEYVVSKNNITVKSDKLFENIEIDNSSMIILPGGPVVDSYNSHKQLLTMIENYDKSGKTISAICAAPTVLGKLGILKGKKAICFPNLEDQLIGAEVIDVPVICDGNIITSKGPGTTMHFAFAIVEKIKGKEIADRIKKAFIF